MSLNALAPVITRVAPDTDFAGYPANIFAGISGIRLNSNIEFFFRNFSSTNLPTDLFYILISFHLPDIRYNTSYNGTRTKI